MSKPTINGHELIAALPVVDGARAEIVQWYVVLDQGDEYVTVALASLGHEGEWGGSGFYTTSLGRALAKASSMAEAHNASFNSGTSDI